MSHGIPTGSRETKGRGFSESLSGIVSSAFIWFSLPQSTNCEREKCLSNSLNLNGLQEASLLDVSFRQSNFPTSLMKMVGSIVADLRMDSTRDTVVDSFFKVAKWQQISTLHNLRVQVRSTSSKICNSCSIDNPVNLLLSSLSLMSSFPNIRSSSPNPDEQSFFAGRKCSHTFASCLITWRYCNVNATAPIVPTESEVNVANSSFKFLH